MLSVLVHCQEGNLVMVRRPGGEARATGTKDGLESCVKDQRCPQRLRRTKSQALTKMSWVLLPQGSSVCGFEEAETAERSCQIGS